MVEGQGPSEGGKHLDRCFFFSQISQVEMERLEIIPLLYRDELGLVTLSGLAER